MSLLSTITRGKENRPPRLFVYGQEGVGKSLFSASAPSPDFVQTEDGLGEIDTAKFPLAKSLADVTSAMTALRDEPHDFQTVVLDSADWLERLIWDRVCQDFGVRSISKDGRRYREAVEAVARRAGNPTLAEPVEVALDLYPPDNRRRDADNRLKSCLDALTCARVYEDDSLIQRLTVTKKEPQPPDGLAVVRIKEYEQKETRGAGEAGPPVP